MTRILAVRSPEKAAAAGGGFDAVVLVGHAPAAADLALLRPFLRAAAAADAKFASGVSMLPAAGIAGNRLVVSPTGPLGRDHDDVRRHAEAAGKGLRRARDAGARDVLLLLQPAPNDARYAEAVSAAILGALGALWEPLEAREALGPSVTEPVRRIGVHVLGGEVDARTIAWAEAADAGLRLARDLAGTEPERMAPPRFAQFVQKAFRGLPVKVAVQKDVKKLTKDYPLLMAVARASLPVARHRPCVVRLEYTPKGRIERTLLFAGKGLTYDTGGADLKTGGVMAGMSRDKGGAAAVAGLVLAAAMLKTKGVRIVAELGVVRNSIGSDAFVSDEIVTSHAGCRVRIGNTDAEGRLVLADLLSHLRFDAAKADAPRLFTVATLTGHAGRAVGPYNIALDNGPARALGTAESLAAAGDRHGDPFEVSRLRREDFDFVQPRSRADDVLSCNNAPSSATARGHQFPMAFLCLASGLHKHGGDSAVPLPFTHVDIGGSGCEGGDWQHGRPTGRPLVAMLTALCGASPTA
ncbi:MAG: leucyl aminopeptidase family protein [Planctomycetes bacterium]|nr:leucyl aminopeptidase family protein [Planctomycetota bacterium]